MYHEQKLSFYEDKILSVITSELLVTSCDNLWVDLYEANLKPQRKFVYICCLLLEQM